MNIADMLDHILLGVPLPEEKKYRKKLFDKAFEGDMGAQATLHRQYSLTMLYRDGVTLFLSS